MCRREVWAGNTTSGVTRVEMRLNALSLDKIPQGGTVASKGTLRSTETERSGR